MAPILITAQQLSTRGTEISKFSKTDVKGYDGLLAESKKIFEIGFEQLSDEPFHKLSTFASSVPDMIRLRAYRNVYQLVSAHLKHPKLRELLVSNLFL